MQSQQNVYGFFSDMRSDAKDIIGVGDTMCIQTDFSRPRGIRSWEKARFEANIRRQREQQFYENIKKMQRMKNKSLQIKNVDIIDKDDNIEILNTNDSVIIPNNFNTTGNDAWDD